MHLSQFGLRQALLKELPPSALSEEDRLEDQLHAEPEQAVHRVHGQQAEHPRWVWAPGVPLAPRAEVGRKDAESSPQQQVAEEARQAPSKPWVMVAARVRKEAELELSPCGRWEA